ncbi:MAG TPA: PTS sugar transporter subunit IIC [Anaerolineae bacterium]|nr:PTS sugar transporter subunit IIC [Anaerolineae bacterium]
MEIIPVLILMGGIVALDTTAGPQILISEPIVTCSTVGLLFGRCETGLIMGMFFQLLFLGYKPLGAIRFTDSNMGAFIGTASLLTGATVFDFNSGILKAAIIVALFYGIFVGFVGLHLTAIVRRMNAFLSDGITSRLEKDKLISITRWHLVGIGASFSRGALMTVILIPFGAFLCGSVLLMPLNLVESLVYAVTIIWGTVCASAVLLYWLRGTKRFFFVGFVGGVLWVMMIISRAI